MFLLISTALDLLSKMLTIDPEERITVDEALKHTYVETHADADDEPVSEQYIEACEKMQHPIEKWRGMYFRFIK